MGKDEVTRRRFIDPAGATVSGTTTDKSRHKVVRSKKSVLKTKGSKADEEVNMKRNCLKAAQAAAITRGKASGSTSPITAADTGPRERAYFLLKTEPFEFSITDLRNSEGGVSKWTGIRNAQARNNLVRAAPGDVCFVYHSSCGKEAGIVGTAAVVRSAYPDPTALDPDSKYCDPQEAVRIAACGGSGVSGVSPTSGAKWYCIDVKYVDSWHPPLLLSTLKAFVANPAPASDAEELRAVLGGLQLFKFSRLSVQQVRPEEAQALHALRDRQHKH
jgi:predicted RNA-binding protein with PUA-like domain